MGVDEGYLRVVVSKDVDVILEDCSITNCYAYLKKIQNTPI